MEGHQKYEIVAIHMKSSRGNSNKSISHILCKTHGDSGERYSYCVKEVKDVIKEMEVGFEFFTLDEKKGSNPVVVVPVPKTNGRYIRGGRDDVQGNNLLNLPRFK